MMATLLEEVKELIDSHPEANVYELQSLRLAGDLIWLCRRLLFDEEIPESIWPRITVDEYRKMPNRFELLEGRIWPKDWELYEEAERRDARF